MCSVSWKWDSSGEELEIFFNRDESKSRKTGLPPQVFDSNLDCRYICPVDGEKGGTWFAVNEYGLAIGVLNQYRAVAPKSREPKERRSRGELVKRLIEISQCPEDVDDFLRFDLEKELYPPFTLIAWGRHDMIGWSWNGAEIREEPEIFPLVTSSSWEPARVEAWRKALYNEKVERGNWSNEEFHRYAVPGDEASSVCMTREKTQTISLTIARITRDTVSMRYFPRDEDGNFGDESAAELERRQR